MDNAKPCKKCGENKPLGDFYAHPRMADGHLGFCKGCVRDRVTIHRKKNLDRIQEYDRRRFRDPERRARAAEYQARHRQRHPERSIARQAVNNAVRDGRLIRCPCEACGTTEQIQAHHDDYSKPLAVRWMCFKCHREIAHGQRVTVSN